MAYGLSGFGLMVIITWTVIVIGSIIGMRVRNSLYHGAWAVVFFGLMTYFEFLFFGTLRAD